MAVEHGCLWVNKMLQFRAFFMSRLTSEFGPGLSSAMLFAALALPALLPFHPRPQPTFLVEVLTATLLCIAWLLSPFVQIRAERLRVCVPALVLGLCVLLFLHFGHSAALWGYLQYLALFLVCYLWGCVASDDQVRIVARAMLCGAFLQAVIVMLQLRGVKGGGWLLPLAGERAVGNVGHPNLLADLLLLGMVALACPDVVGRLAGAGRIAVALLLGLALSATGSRGAWLGITAFLVIGAWRARRQDGGEARALLQVGGAAVVSQCLFALVGVLSPQGLFVSSLARNGSATSNDARGYLLEIAARATLDAPWLGHGPGTFWQVSVEALQHERARAFPMLAEHAHNLPLNLAVEFGFPASLLVCAGLVLWCGRRLVYVAPTRLWALAGCWVVLLHSLVEYPLWYVYLLVPCAVCMGFAECERESEPTPTVWYVTLCAGWVRGVGAVGLVLCLFGAKDWMHLRLAHEQLLSSGELTGRLMSLSARDELAQMSSLSTMKPLARSLMLQSLRIEDDDLAMAAEACKADWAKRPTWFMLKSCAEVFAVSGREFQLGQVLNVQCKGFPEHHLLLAEWADRFDRMPHAGLALGHRACLAEISAVSSEAGEVAP